MPVLAAALPVFLLADLPMVGYAVCAVAWVSASAVQLAADRRVKRSLARGNRNSALGTLAAATLGRVWLVALAILLVGLSDRESGLAAAVLAAALVTVHLAGMTIGRLISPDEERAVSARLSKGGGGRGI
ncbi:MAG TPA: hypothetical protein VE523_03880 [Solirubrobacterales bacterium]|nr:hypothetical protein [Solirubrobacterales bacterium]